MTLQCSVFSVRIDRYELWFNNLLRYYDNIGYIINIMIIIVKVNYNNKRMVHGCTQYTCTVVLSF